MRLREIRLSKKISVPKLVEMTGLSRRTIQEIEKRDASTVANAIKLADALGITLDELCREDAVSLPDEN